MHHTRRRCEVRSTTRLQVTVTRARRARDMCKVSSTNALLVSQGLARRPTQARQANVKIPRVTSKPIHSGKRHLKEGSCRMHLTDSHHVAHNRDVRIDGRKCEESNVAHGAKQARGRTCGVTTQYGVASGILGLPYGRHGVRPTPTKLPLLPLTFRDAITQHDGTVRKGGWYRSCIGQGPFTHTSVRLVTEHYEQLVELSPMNKGILKCRFGTEFSE